MNASTADPAIPPRLQRPLVALWISLGLHAALIAWVQVSPPASLGVGEPVIEARLVSVHVVPDARQDSPAEAPGKLVDAVPLSASEPGVRANTTPQAEASHAAPPPPLEAPATQAAAPASPPVQAPAAAITSAVDLTFYNAREVDVHPRSLREIVPDYPDDADRGRLSGKVRLQVRLEADGRVVDVEVVNATPPGVFDESAVRAFREARFAAAQRNGRAVRALVLIDVVYDWEGRSR